MTQWILIGGLTTVRKHKKSQWQGTLHISDETSTTALGGPGNEMMHSKLYGSMRLRKEAAGDARPSPMVHRITSVVEHTRNWRS